MSPGYYSGVFFYIRRQGLVTKSFLKIFVIQISKIEFLNN